MLLNGGARLWSQAWMMTDDSVWRGPLGPAIVRGMTVLDDAGLSAGPKTVDSGTPRASATSSRMSLRETPRDGYRFRNTAQPDAAGDVR